MYVCLYIGNKCTHLLCMYIRLHVCMHVYEHPCASLRSGDVLRLNISRVEARTRMEKRDHEVFGQSVIYIYIYIYIYIHTYGLVSHAALLRLSPQRNPRWNISAYVNRVICLHAYALRLHMQTFIFPKSRTVYVHIYTYTPGLVW